MSIRNIIKASAGFLFLAACNASPDATSNTTATGPVCNLALAADFPVTYVDGEPTIIVTIDGHKLRMVLDSGSEESFLAPAAYDLLNIHQSFHGEHYVVEGLGGTADIDTFILKDIYFGSVHLHDEVLGVFPHDVNVPQGHQAEDGVIGFDILEPFDVAFDLPHNRVTFYQPKNCTVSATPWQGDFAAVPYTRTSGFTPLIPVSINNQTFQMFLDSDSSSLVFQHSLDANGIKPEASQPANVPGTAIAGQSINLKNVQFQSIGIGAETFQDAWLLDDTTPQSLVTSTSDGTVGLDYLKTHRVFVVNSTHTVYLGLTIQPGS